MSFFDDVKQAWGNSDQARLIGLMRLDYNHDEDVWGSKSVDFLAASEDAQVQPVKLFSLAKQVHEQLIGSRKQRWQLRIIPHLLNLYQGKDFDAEQWVVVAAGDKLPEHEPAWGGIETWVAEWVKGRLSLNKIRDTLGFFDVRTEGAGRHRPGIFHPLVLRIAQEVMNPAEAFTLELAKWLFNNAVKVPVAGAVVGTGFAAGATVLKLAASQQTSQDWQNLSTELLATFEKNCLCNENAPAVWQGKEKEVRQLLNECPFWYEAKRAADLRGLALVRLKKTAAAVSSEIKRASGELPSLHNMMSDAVSFSLPQYRSTDPKTLFWKDERFSILTESLKKIEVEASKQEEKLKAAAAQSKISSLSCHTFSAITRTPVCSTALPQAFSELNLREYSVRLLLTQQLRSTRMVSKFPFEQSEFLADTPSWHDAVHGSATSGSPAATLASWLALEPWDGLRGKFMSGELAEADMNDAKELWKQVHENAQFKLLVADPPSTLPAAADLVPLRQKLAMLTLTGHPDWEKLLDTLVKALERLTANLDANSDDYRRIANSDAYRLVAAARLDLSVTAAAAGLSPAAAVGGSTLEDFNAFKELLVVAKAALDSALAWETQAGFNTVILLARFVELIGDLFFAKELQDSISSNNRINGLIKESVRKLSQGEVLPGSDLPLALAASDLLRFARERGAGIAGGLAAAPAWPSSDLTKLVRELTAKFTDTAVLQKMAVEGGLGFRLFLLAVMQTQLDQFERGRRLLVRPPKDVEEEGFVGLNTLHGLHQAVRMAFCAEPLLRLGLHDEQDAYVPWQPGYWFAKGSRPNDERFVQTVNWLESWEDNDAGLSQAQVNAFGWAAWFDTRIPKRLPAGFDRDAVYSSELLCDIDGRYPGELPYSTYKEIARKLDEKAKEMEQAHDKFIVELKAQKNDINSSEIKKLLKEPLRLNTSDFREQIQAALAEVRRAEAELEAAEHESLAAEFEVIANQMLLDAAKLEMEREQKNIQVKELDAKISSIGVEIAKLDEQIAVGGVEEKKNTVEKAKLVIEQTKLRKQQAQAQLDAIKLEIEFIRKIVGAEDPNNPGAYGIPVEINGVQQTANGQMAAMALRTKDILSKQIARQIEEATKALREAEEAEEKARKKAKRNGLIKAACRFIGSVVGAIYGGPAGAALGAEIGEALAELTIGIMDNKPPMDILTGLVDNAFSIASAAGFDLEKELNAMGSKAAGEITSTLKGFEEKFKPMLAEMPKVLDQGVLQDALEVLGLEELNNVSGLSGKLYEGIKKDIGNLGQIGTMLKDFSASGFETADQLTDHLKTHLISETTRFDADKLEALANRVGEQVEALTGHDPAARREALEKAVADKVAPLITGAIATKAGQIRQRVMKDWIGGKRGGNQFWNVPAVKEEGEKLLAHLFPENEKARADAAVNMALALLPPDVYQGEIQKYLHPYQQKQDALIKGILDMGEPSGNGSEFWRNQLKHLNEAKTKFEKELFPFMEGKSLDANPHPRTELLLKLAELERGAENEFGNIKILTIQSGIDDLDLASAQTKLQQANDELEKAGKLVNRAELHVQKESLLMQIAQISLKKADSLAEAQKQAESAAKARAAAAKAKIKAAKAGLDAKLALFVGAQRRGVEAGRIRSGLDRPAVLLDIPGYRLNETRRNYANAFHNALEAYRELVRYCLGTFFSTGEQQLPKFVRPDLLTNSAVTWHEALSGWQEQLEKKVKELNIRGKIAVKTEVFHWDLTLEQIAALTSPSGLILQVAPQLNREETLLEIPKAFLVDDPNIEPSRQRLRQGPLAKAALEFFRENKLHLTTEAKLDLADPERPKLIDEGEKKVEVILHDKNKVELCRKKIADNKDRRAYQLIPVDDSPEKVGYFHVKYSFDDYRGREKGRSLPSDRYLKMIDADHAKNGRIVALFIGIRDDEQESPYSSTADYDFHASSTGSQWIARNLAYLTSSREFNKKRDEQQRDIISRIIDWPNLQLSQTHELETSFLKNKFIDSTVNIDGDVDLSQVQGPPVAGTHRIRLSFVAAPNQQRTVGAASIVVLYKHYSSN